jgi:hypothetical protein
MLFGFGKPRIPKSQHQAVADFERELQGVIVKARLFSVPAGSVLRELEKYCAGMRREAQHVVEQRAMRTTPVQYDGFGKRVQC